MLDLVRSLDGLRLMAAADEEGDLGYMIRDYLVVGDSLHSLQIDYELGLLTLPDCESTVNCIAIAEVADTVLVAAPWVVWSRHRKRRKLDPDALTRVFHVEVPAAWGERSLAPGPFLNHKAMDRASRHIARGPCPRPRRERGC